MPQVDKPALLPCPFCGGKPILWPMKGWESPFCERCGASIMETVTPGNTKAHIKAWNRRASGAAVPALPDDERDSLDLKFDCWLKTVCFQKPTPEARDLAWAAVKAFAHPTQPQARASRPASAAPGEPCLFADGDREMLNALHQEFENTTHFCERCGEADDLKTFDAAYMLRDYLAKHPVPAASPAPDMTVGRASSPIAPDGSRSSPATVPSTTEDKP